MYVCYIFSYSFNSYNYFSLSDLYLVLSGSRLFLLTDFIFGSQSRHFPFYSPQNPRLPLYILFFNLSIFLFPNKFRILYMMFNISFPLFGSKHTNFFDKNFLQLLYADGYYIYIKYIHKCLLYFHFTFLEVIIHNYTTEIFALIISIIIEMIGKHLYAAISHEALSSLTNSFTQNSLI